MIFYYVTGGALVCDEPIEGITQDIDADERWYNGHRYFVAESMSKETARRLAHVLGGVLMESNVEPTRQLPPATGDLRRELSRHAMYGVHSR